jgi:cytochrome c oxidase subunit 3
MVLAASSVLVESAARLGQRGRWRSASASLGGALAHGGGFLLGQIAAWRQMVAAGAYLASSPHSSFFFVLTGAHALHLGAALIVLSWGVARTRSGARDPRAWQADMGLCRTFWHYLGGVWVFLFALMALY